jgi:predicted metalloprotease with PDZ domain
MACGLHYRVTQLDTHAHQFHLELTIARPAAQQVVRLPVWIAGSYLVREFAKQLSGLNASQAGRARAVTQLDKASWRIDCSDQHPLTLRWQVHAHDASVRTAWLDSLRGFFNGTSLFLQVQGQEDQAHEISLPASVAPPTWRVATGLQALKVDKRGFGSYLAANYDELVDCPVEMGDFWSATFKAGGITHEFVVAGATPAFDGARLIADSQKICEAQIRFWHGKGKPPHTRYVFMLWAVGDGYGGLEHRNSTALICNRNDLPRVGQKGSEGYTTLLGLISHEYFHTWNVKRLRPHAFARYDYQQENYTELLWFFEGFTSYYDDLFLCRTGLIDEAQYLKLLNKTINQVLQTPGRQVHTVAQSSFEAWTKYYRTDENSPNLTVSYYTKGALVALCLDLSLRSEGHSLDKVMRALWKRCQAGPMQESDLLAVLAELTGRSWQKELKAWVHSTQELPLDSLLHRHGVALIEEPAQWAQRLGLRVTETQGIQVKTVLRGGVARAAGFAPGDEWLGIEVPAGKGRKASAWRLSRLEELLLYAGAATQVTALVSRDRQLLRLPLSLKQLDKATTARLVLSQPDPVKRWLKD